MKNSVNLRIRTFAPSLIGVAIIAGVKALGTKLSHTFASVSGNMT
jgi:Flp pilus assembly pilin Flp